MAQLINLTPHDIVLFADDLKTHLQTIPSSGVVRVNSRQIRYAVINGFPVYSVEYTGIDEIPPPQPDTFYIVSSVVLQYLKGKRWDLLAPNTKVSKSVRDEAGTLQGVTGFISIL